MIPDREKYPLPEEMFWDDQGGELGPGAKSSNGWWHAWIDEFDGVVDVHFDTHPDNFDAPSARGKTKHATPEDALQYISNMLMMGFR